MTQLKGTYLVVVVERRVDWAICAMVLVFGSNGHILLVRVFGLWWVICLVLLEVWSHTLPAPYSQECDQLLRLSGPALALTPLVAQRLPSIVVSLGSTDVHQIVDRTGAS